MQLSLALKSDYKNSICIVSSPPASHTFLYQVRSFYKLYFSNAKPWQISLGLWAVTLFMCSQVALPLKTSAFPQQADLFYQMLRCKHTQANRKWPSGSCWFKKNQTNNRSVDHKFFDRYSFMSLSPEVHLFILYVEIAPLKSMRCLLWISMGPRADAASIYS